MAATTTGSPIAKYWSMVKDLDDSMKLELVTMLIESVKPTVAKEPSMEDMLEGYPFKRYTKAELNAMLDEAERDFDAGLGIDDDDAWDDLEEELAREEQEKFEMAEAG